MLGRIDEDRERRTAAVARLYFFLLSDAYRELREAEVRWECFAASQYHFDDGARFVLEGAGERFPVDHPIWTSYSEKVVEIGARVARADERKRAMLSRLEGIKAAFLRFCREQRLEPARVAELGTSVPAGVADMERAHPDVAPDADTLRETYELLRLEWERNGRVAGARS